VAVAGTNAPQQVAQVAAAVRQPPADEAERERILAEAPELGCYVCRRCGRCPEPLMDTFRLEGEHDRQMIDFLPHGPAEAALRKVLSRWFGHDAAAREAFAASGRQAGQLVAAGERVECPYGIDVARKARLATTKLTGGRVTLV